MHHNMYLPEISNDEKNKLSSKLFKKLLHQGEKNLNSVKWNFICNLTAT